MCLIDFEYSGFGDFEKRQEDIVALSEIRERVFQTVDSGSVLEYLKNKTRKITITRSSVLALGFGENTC